MCRYPEAASIEEHLVDIIDRMDALQPQRVVIDSLAALERSTGDQPFREFVMAITGLVKERQITGLCTVATTLLGGGHPTEAEASVLTDTIILRRYDEAGISLGRTITVLKMRGSTHDQRVRGFAIDDHGLHIGDPTGHAHLTGRHPGAGPPMSAEPTPTELLAKLLATTPDGLLLVDTDGIIRYANPAAETLFRHAPGTLTGQPFGLPHVTGSPDIDLVRGDGSLRSVEMRPSSPPGRASPCGSSRYATRPSNARANSNCSPSYRPAARSPGSSPTSWAPASR